MRRRRTVRPVRRRESGYALLLAVFLAAAMLIATAVIAPNLLTQGTRQKEEELVWRGQQYARAVRLYYRKYGRFPQSLEDLTKPKDQAKTHFLRKVYTDPMNRQDGSWRLIYIAPNGQLIGSVKQRNPLTLPGALGTPAGMLQPPAAPGTPPQGVGQAPPAAPGTPAPTQPAPAGSAEEGKIFGGNIIGVGSKVNRPSIRVYDGGTTYREWEFIWDPTKDVTAVGLPISPGGAPVNPSPPNPQSQPQPPNPPIRP
jgi:type II secretory pathway pseudopilin PulG